MKIKIDKNGYLWLERSGKMKKVECPEDHYPERYGACGAFIDYKHWSCGDWCSLFREEIATVYEAGGLTRKAAQINLCKNYHTCFIEDFTDERGGE